MNFAKTLIPIVSYMVLSVGLSAQITVNSSGYVGIGTTSPTQALTLGASQNILLGTGGGQGGALLLSRGYASANPILSAGSGGIFYHHNGGTLGNNEAMKLVGEEFRFSKSVSSADVFTINTLGNVGVGTTTPDAAVDIWKSYSAGTDSLRFSFNDGSAYWMGIQTYVVGPGNVGYKFRTHNVTNTVDALAITGNGSIGIGTTNPAAKLTIIASPTLDPLQLKDSSGVSFRLGPSVGAVGGFQFYDDNAAATRLRIDSSGNVGIGTTSPAEKLHVVGKVRATSFISDTTTYADFVFDPEYELQSLEEVETHIEEHGHLPDIPSEAEAMANGIDLAAMQVSLLQKIEELTLHVIRQQKEIDELKSQR